MGERTYELFCQQADDFIATFATEHNLGPIDACEQIGALAITYTFETGMSVTVRKMADGKLMHRVYDR